MTLNEKRQLTNYIKGLVRESINEFDPRRPYEEWGGSSPKMLRVYKDEYPKGATVINPEVEKGDPNRKVFIPKEAIKIWREDYVAVTQDVYNEYCLGSAEEKETDDEFNELSDSDNVENIENNEPAGINELRRLTEGMAREVVANILFEKKGGKGWKKPAKGKKRKSKKEKSSSRDKTVISALNNDGTNAAHYYYKLYGVENGTEIEKAAARSKGYKKAKGKKNDTGVPYKFSSKEKNRLTSLLTDR